MEYFETEIVEDIVIESVKLVKITYIEAKLFWDILQTSVLPKYNRIIIDISKCSFIDSAFVGVLLRTNRLLSKEKGELKLVINKDHEEKFFTIMGINRLIDTSISLSEAINGFKKKDKSGNLVEA